MFSTTGWFPFFTQFDGARHQLRRYEGSERGDKAALKAKLDVRHSPSLTIVLGVAIPRYLWESTLCLCTCARRTRLAG